MKKIIITFVAALIVSSAAFAQTQTSVSGYRRSDGTYVQPHSRSVRDNTNHNNWGTVGNTNPKTGVHGSVAKDYSPQATNYGKGRTIHTGSQGGQYYYNSKGNRTYVPKQPATTTYRNPYRR